jgi:two-component system, sensor histidine kinase PdtaS
MPRILPTLLFALLPLLVGAQGGTVLEPRTRDSTQFRALYKAFNAVVHQQPDSAMALAHIMGNMARIAREPRWGALADQCLGQAWRVKGHIHEALGPFQRALTAFERSGDHGRAAMVHANISSILLAEQQWEKARRHGVKAVAGFERTGQPIWAAAAMEDLAQAYLGLGIDDSARVLLLRAAPILERAGMRDHDAPLREVEAGLHLMNDEEELARQLYRGIFRDTTAVAPGILRARILLDMGRALDTLGMAPRAIISVQAALLEAEKGGFDQERMEAHRLLATLHAQADQFADAYHHVQAWTALRERIASASTSMAIAELQERFEAARKDVVMERQAAMITRQRMGLLAAVLVAVLLVWVVVTMARARYRHKRHMAELADGHRALQEALGQKDLLLRELHHRVKNNLQLVGSLLRMQGRGIADPAARHAVRDSQDRVRSMALVHQDLYRVDDPRGIELRPYVERLVKGLLDSHAVPKERIAVHSEVDEMRLDVDTAVPIGLILNELVVNALKHAFPNERRGTIRITLSLRAGSLFLEVADDGIGHDGNKTVGGFGLAMLQAFADKLKARYEMNGDPGTAVRITMNEFTLAQ